MATEDRGVTLESKVCAFWMALSLAVVVFSLGTDHAVNCAIWGVNLGMAVMGVLRA